MTLDLLMNAPSMVGHTFVYKSLVPVSSSIGSSISSWSSQEPGEEKGKMTPWQAYFAIIKAYCVINILLLPKAFKYGGYLLSPAILLVAAISEGVCAMKLVQCGLFSGHFSYTDIVHLALGYYPKMALRLLIALIQF